MYFSIKTNYFRDGVEHENENLVNKLNLISL